MTMVTIGRVTSPFGVKGAVKVYPFSDFLERCYQLEEVTLLFSQEKAPAQKVIVNNSFIQGRQWVLYFKGYNSREEALALKNAFVQIPREKRMPLPENHYYFDEIIGLQAITKEGQFLGVVKDIIQTGSNDVYVIHAEVHAKDILVPALKQVVLQINKKENTITLDLPEGLLDIYEVVL